MTARFPLEPAATRETIARPVFDLLCHLEGPLPRRVGVLQTGPTPTTERLGALFPGAAIEGLDLRPSEGAPAVAGRDAYDLIYPDGPLATETVEPRVQPDDSARGSDAEADR